MTKRTERRNFYFRHLWLWHDPSSHSLTDRSLGSLLQTKRFTRKVLFFHFVTRASISSPCPRGLIFTCWGPGMFWFVPLTWSNWAGPLLFIPPLCLFFCLYGPFNCISFHQFCLPLFVFSLCSSCLFSVLLVLSAIYLFVKVSFSPDIIPSGWLGSKHQQSNKHSSPF